MELPAFRKQYVLDITQHGGLLRTMSEQGSPTVVRQPPGYAMCELLNLPDEVIANPCKRLEELVRVSIPDVDAYRMVLSMHIGRVPLRSSPFAAELFELLAELSDVHPLIAMTMHMDRLITCFEQEAPEKTLLEQFCDTVCRAAVTMHILQERLPMYRHSTDAICNRTLLEKTSAIQDPVLRRAYDHGKDTGEDPLGVGRTALFEVYVEQATQITALRELMQSQRVLQPEERLFYGVVLDELPMDGVLERLFRHMLMSDCVVRVCGVCGRYFVPLVRSNEKYCDFLELDKNGVAQTCKQRSTKKRLEEDPSLKLLKGAYDKNLIRSGRHGDVNYREVVFRPWYAWAKEQRRRYLEQEITLEQMTTLLAMPMEEACKHNGGQLD